MGAIVYGARDSDTSPPVEEAFNWEHGIITKGASIESETTAATLGKVGVREFNPMSNLDFLSIPIGKYIHNYLEFPEEISGKTPKIFSVNYFLKDKNGSFLNEKTDKIAWFKWMEKRVHNECGFIEIPTGKIPLYQDIKEIFKEILDKDYSYEQFNEEFLLRIPENLSKIERILKIYHSIKNIPKELFIILNSQKERLIDAGNRYGDYVIPEKFIK